MIYKQELFIFYAYLLCIFIKILYHSIKFKINSILLYCYNAPSNDSKSLSL